jgi:hypothetical protein
MSAESTGPGSKRNFTAFFVVGLLAVLAFPFAYDAYSRHEVLNRLAPVLTQQDRAAYQAWNGDAQSFAKSLYARCELVNGHGAAACDPYRSAVQ